MSFYLIWYSLGKKICCWSSLISFQLKNNHLPKKKCYANLLGIHESSSEFEDFHSRKMPYHTYHICKVFLQYVYACGFWACSTSWIYHCIYHRGMASLLSVSSCGRSNVLELWNSYHNLRSHTWKVFIRYGCACAWVNCLSLWTLFHNLRLDKWRVFHQSKLTWVSKFDHTWSL